jgi:hypothetical protein
MIFLFFFCTYLLEHCHGVSAVEKIGIANWEGASSQPQVKCKKNLA